MIAGLNREQVLRTWRTFTTPSFHGPGGDGTRSCRVPWTPCPQRTYSAASAVREERLTLAHGRYCLRMQAGNHSAVDQFIVL